MTFHLLADEVSEGSRLAVAFKSKWLKLIVGISVAFALAPAPMAMAGVGKGQTCAHGGNPSSTACVNGQNGETYLGGYDNFTDLSLQMDSNGVSGENHINQEMWFYTHSNESQWVETGIREGYWPGHGSCQCGYGRFWADFNSSGTEFRHLIQYVRDDKGSNHSYQVIRSSSNTDDWNVYLDYNLVGTSTVQGSSTGYEVQMGLEDSLVTPDSSSDLFNHSPLEYMGTNGAFYDFPYMERWEDYPCASNPTGYCLHEQTVGTDVFEASKPG